MMQCPFCNSYLAYGKYGLSNITGAKITTELVNCLNTACEVFPFNAQVYQGNALIYFFRVGKFFVSYARGNSTFTFYKMNQNKDPLIVEIVKEGFNPLLFKGNMADLESKFDNWILFS